MSCELYNQVASLRLDNLLGIKKNVLLHLAQRTNEQMEAWPSTKTIAADLGYSRSAICEALRELKEEGWITSSVGYKGRASNTYFINEEMISVHKPVKKISTLSATKTSPCPPGRHPSVRQEDTNNNHNHQFNKNNYDHVSMPCGQKNARTILKAFGWQEQSIKTYIGRYGEDRVWKEANKVMDILLKDPKRIRQGAGQYLRKFFYNIDGFDEKQYNLSRRKYAA